MKQLSLFNLPEQYNVIDLFKPIYAPRHMDSFADLGAMNWREEIKRRNFKLIYKKPQNIP